MVSFRGLQYSRGAEEDEKGPRLKYELKRDEEARDWDSSGRLSVAKKSSLKDKVYHLEYNRVV